MYANPKVKRKIAVCKCHSNSCNFVDPRIKNLLVITSNIIINISGNDNQAPTFPENFTIFSSIKLTCNSFLNI